MGERHRHRADRRARRHLHPRWKMQITRTLRRVFPSMQFLVTTHEPLCLRGLVENEVVRVTLIVDPTWTAWHAVFDPIEESPSRYRVDRLLTSAFFGLDTTIDPDRRARVPRVLRPDPQADADPRGGRTGAATLRAHAVAARRARLHGPRPAGLRGDRRVPGPEPELDPGSGSRQRQADPEPGRRHLAQRRRPTSGDGSAVIRVDRTAVPEPAVAVDAARRHRAVHAARPRRERVVVAVRRPPQAAAAPRRSSRFDFKALQGRRRQAGPRHAVPRQVRLLRVAVRRHPADGRRALAAEGRGRRAGRQRRTRSWPGLPWLASTWDEPASRPASTATAAHPARRARPASTRPWARRTSSRSTGRGWPPPVARRAAAVEDPAAASTPRRTTPPSTSSFHDDGTVTPVDAAEKGIESIRVYALNRAELAFERLGLARLIEQRLTHDRGPGERDRRPETARRSSSATSRTSLSHEIDALLELAEPDRPYSALARQLIEESSPG